MTTNTTAASPLDRITRITPIICVLRPIDRLPQMHADLLFCANPVRC